MAFLKNNNIKKLSVLYLRKPLHEGDKPMKLLISNTMIYHELNVVLGRKKPIISGKEKGRKHLKRLATNTFYDWYS